MNLSPEPCYDVVGVGFGPSNLALAIALDEHPGVREQGLSRLFLERQPAFGWHRNMLLPATTMQVAFLKDLATFRNPLSRFTFVNYLHSTRSLSRFVNTSDFFPTRAEFHSYLEWAESQVSASVRYGSEAVGLERSDHPGLARVVVRDAGTGAEHSVLARNIVVSTGLVPRVPAGVTVGRRIWHSSQFLSGYRAVAGVDLSSVVVVGAGQSAAEVARFLLDDLPGSAVHAVMPAYGYTVADATPFANEIFDPEAVDDYHFGTERSRNSFWHYHANTNYAVVDDDVIRDLYRRGAHDELRQGRRLHLHRLSRLRRAQETEDRVTVAIDSQLAGTVDELDADAVVLATGYEPMDPRLLLGELDGDCLRDEAGKLVVRRDHRVATSPAVDVGIYLQGGTEHSHGLSSSLLSNVAVRSGEIVESITAHAGRPALVDAGRRSVAGDAA